MYSGSTKSALLVTAQFLLIVLIAWHASVWGGALQNVLTVLGVALGLWAIICMKFKVNVFPDVRQGQQLYTGGPYRYIRHPMYTAVLLATGGWALNQPDFISLVLWAALTIDLLLKLRHEEKLLIARFPDYAGYSARTKRLIPLVY